MSLEVAFLMFLGKLSYTFSLCEYLLPRRSMTAQWKSWEKNQALWKVLKCAAQNKSQPLKQKHCLLVFRGPLPSLLHCFQPEVI